MESGSRYLRKALCLFLLLISISDTYADETKQIINGKATETSISFAAVAGGGGGGGGGKLLSGAHDQLADKGFPAGLLPNSVANYSYNSTSEDFQVQLHGRCDIILPPDNYPASFKSIIRGKLSEGHIQKLNGVRVRAFFKWWTIVGIKSDGDDLVFDVGVTSVKYPASKFGESPDCGGGQSHSSS